MCVKNAPKSASAGVIGVLSRKDGIKTGLCPSGDATCSLGVWALQLLWQHGGPSHGASLRNVKWEIGIILLPGKAKDMF